MSAERPRRFAALVPLLALVAGCATTSLGDDLQHVRARVGAALPEAALREEVTSDAAPEVARALAEPLTADAAVRVAMLHNRGLRATLRELGVPRGALVQAGLLPNPAVEFDLRYQQDRTQPLQGDVALEFALTRALLAPARASAARAELEAARVRASGAAVSLGFEVRAAFFAAQAAEERLRLGQRALDTFAAGRDAARSLREAGNVPALDVAAQEAAYESARVTVAELELAHLDARERLTRLLGLAGDETTWRLAGPLAAVPPEARGAEMTETQAVRASLELEALRARMEATARRIGLSRAEGWTPDITLDVHGEQDGASLEFGGGARVTLPMFDRRQGQRASLEAEFDGMMERYHGLAVDVRSALRALRNRVRSTHARARAWDEVIVPARGRVLEETVLQYNAMRAGVFQVLQARRAQLDAELAAVSARRAYWTAAAALDAMRAGWRVEATSTPAEDTTTTRGADSAAEGGH